MKLFDKLFHREQKKFNLLIVGAQKCGTTSLHHALSMHPDIFMTNPIKEPGYFLPFEVMQAYYSKKGIHIKSEKQYLKKHLLKGYKGEKYFGESSTFYTTEEWSSLFLAKKIFNYNNNMKIIYLYRNRTDRMLSHFHHEYAKNNTLKFPNFLNNKEAFGISLYSKRILPFVQTFESKNILILSFEKLISHPDEVMTNIYEFLEIDNTITFDQFPKLNQKNIVRSPIEYAAMKLQIQQHPRYKELNEDDKLFMHLTKTES